MGEKHNPNFPSVRFIFWATTLFPVVALFVALGPKEFASMLNVICTVDNAVVPSSIVRNTQGYAVVDRLYLHQGTPYIVADSKDVFDNAKEIIEASCDVLEDHPSECQPRVGALQVVSLEAAQQKFGRFIHKIPGVAFISTPSTLSSASELPTLLSGLWQTYSTLPTSFPFTSSTPRKLLLPSISSSSSLVSYQNQNSNTSFLSVETKKRWSEWAETNDPRRFERAVVAYRQI